MSQPPVTPDYNKLINIFLWRFFGTAFLVFVLFKMIGDFRESSTNDLGDKLDANTRRIEQQAENMRKAVQQ